MKLSKSVWIALFSCFILSAKAEWRVDSTKHQLLPKKYTLTLTTRVHTKGFFSYAGRIINSNPAADIYINYNRNNKWGINLFKVADLNDFQSGNNFLLFLVNKNFVISKKFNTNFYGGFLLEQPHHFAGHGSDIVSNITTTYKVNSKISIDHMALFGNMIVYRTSSDWVNRFRILFTSKHIDVTAWGWLNNKVFDRCSYRSAGLSAYYSRIPIARKLKLSAGITSLVMFYTSDESTAPKRNGILFTLATTWNN